MKRSFKSKTRAPQTHLLSDFATEQEMYLLLASNERLRADLAILRDGKEAILALYHLTQVFSSEQFAVRKIEYQKKIVELFDGLREEYRSGNLERIYNQAINLIHKASIDSDPVLAFTYLRKYRNPPNILKKSIADHYLHGIGVAADPLAADEIYADLISKSKAEFLKICINARYSILIRHYPEKLIGFLTEQYEKGNLDLQLQVTLATHCKESLAGYKNLDLALAIFEKISATNPSIICMLSQSEIFGGISQPDNIQCIMKKFPAYRHEQLVRLPIAYAKKLIELLFKLWHQEEVSLRDCVTNQNIFEGQYGSEYLHNIQMILGSFLINEVTLELLHKIKFVVEIISHRCVNLSAEDLTQIKFINFQVKCMEATFLDIDHPETMEIFRRAWEEFKAIELQMLDHNIQAVYQLAKIFWRAPREFRQQREFDLQAIIINLARQGHVASVMTIIENCVRINFPGLMSGGQLKLHEGIRATIHHYQALDDHELVQQIEAFAEIQRQKDMVIDDLIAVLEVEPNEPATSSSNRIFLEAEAAEAAESVVNVGATNEVVTSEQNSSVSVESDAALQVAAENQEELLNPPELGVAAELAVDGEAGMPLDLPTSPATGVDAELNLAKLPQGEKVFRLKTVEQRRQEIEERRIVKLRQEQERRGQKIAAEKQKKKEQKAQRESRRAKADSPANIAPSMLSLGRSDLSNKDRQSEAKLQKPVAAQPGSRRAAPVAQQEMPEVVSSRSPTPVQLNIGYSSSTTSLEDLSLSRASSPAQVSTPASALPENLGSPVQKAADEAVTVERNAARASANLLRFEQTCPRSPVTVCRDDGSHSPSKDEFGIGKTDSWKKIFTAPYRGDENPSADFMLELRERLNAERERKAAEVERARALEQRRILALQERANQERNFRYSLLNTRRISYPPQAWDAMKQRTALKVNATTQTEEAGKDPAARACPVSKP